MNEHYLLSIDELVETIDDLNQVITQQASYISKLERSLEDAAVYKWQGSDGFGGR